MLDLLINRILKDFMSINEFDENFLKKTLEKAGYAIKDLRVDWVKRAGQREKRMGGLVGDCARIRVKFGQKPEHEIHKDSQNYTPLYAKTADWINFQALKKAQRLGVKIPHTYHAEKINNTYLTIQDEVQAEIISVKKLNTLFSKIKNNNQSAVSELKKITQSLLENIRKFHEGTKTDYPSWEWNKEKRKQEIRTYQESEKIYYTFLKSRINSLTEEYGNHLNDEYLEFFDKIAHKLNDFMKENNDSYCMVHGDLSPGNFFTDGTIIDWDTANHNSLYWDLSELYENLTTEKTVKSFYACVNETYGSSVCKKLKKVSDAFSYAHTMMVYAWAAGKTEQEGEPYQTEKNQALINLEKYAHRLGLR